MKLKSATWASCPCKPTSTKAKQDSSQEMARSVVVISSAACEPAVVLLWARTIDFGVPGLRRRRAVDVFRHQRRGVIVGRRRWIGAGMPVACADERDRAGDDGAEERQEDDSFVHT
jgi:hypothetical protein